MKQTGSNSPHKTLHIELACARSEQTRHLLAQAIAVQWQQQHGAVAVFFHADSVAVAASDHPHHESWLALAASNQFPLFLCSAALQRRHIAVDTAAPFTISTLTQWMDRVASGGRHLVLNRYASS